MLIIFKLFSPSTYIRILVSEKPDIVISTPSRTLNTLQSKVRPKSFIVYNLLIGASMMQMLSLSELESLVIDEADLVLSYGHDEDIRAIMDGSYLPKVYQSFLMSATMTKDVEQLKGLVLRSPVCYGHPILSMLYNLTD